MNFYLFIFSSIIITLFPISKNNISDKEYQELKEYLKLKHNVNIEKFDYKYCLVVTTFGGCDFCSGKLIDVIERNKINLSSFAIVSVSGVGFSERLKKISTKERLYLEDKSAIGRSKLSIQVSTLISIKKNELKITSINPNNIDSIIKLTISKF